MATIVQNSLTLADWSKRMDPDGSPAMIAELLSQTNEVQEDAVHKEGNLPTGDRVSVRTGEPEVHLRDINEFVEQSKSTTASFDEPCVIIESYSAVDEEIVKMSGDSARMTEDVAFLSSMSKKWTDLLFKGKPSTHKGVRGLEMRYAQHTNAANSDNVISCGGTTGGLTSIWLIGWSDQTFYCPFPKNTKAGLDMEDLGVETVFSGTKRMRAAVSKFTWRTGVALKDHRYVVRICNIDTDALLGNSGTQAAGVRTNILYKMHAALECIPNPAQVNLAFYMNRTVKTGLGQLGLDKSQSAVTVEPALSQWGKPRVYTRFMGYQLRCVDALTNTEAVVPA